MNIKGNVGIHNKFEIEKVDVRTGEVTQKVEAYNIILDTMWTRICARNTYFNTIVFGTGTGTLSTARATLFTALGNKAVTHVERNYIAATPSTPVLYWKQKIVLLPEEYQNTNITEVGISHTTTSIVTHALIKDSEGNPIAVNKGVYDQITIYATVYVTLAELQSGTEWWNVDGSYEYNLLVRYLLGQETSLTGSYKASPANSLYGKGTASSDATLTADTANKQIDFSTVRYGTTAINFTNGIRSVSYGFNTTSDYKRIFSSVMPSSPTFIEYDITNEAVVTGDGVETRFNLDFPIIIPDSQTIYIDAVQASSPTDYVLEEVWESGLNVMSQYYPSPTTHASEFGISNDGLYLACAGAGSGSYDIKVNKFNQDNGVFRSGSLIVNTGLDEQDKIMFSRNDNFIVCTSKTSTSVKVVSFDKENFTLGSQINTATTTFPNDIVFSKNGNYLIIASTNNNTLNSYGFDNITGQISSSLSNKSGNVGTVDISDDDKYIVTGRSTVSILIATFDNTTGVIGSFTTLTTPPYITKLKFVNNSQNLLVLDASNKAIYVYDFNNTTGSVSNMRTIDITNSTHTPTSFDYNQNNSTIAVVYSASTNSIKYFYYDFSNNSTVAYTVDFFSTDSPYYCKFTNNNKFLITIFGVINPYNFYIYKVEDIQRDQIVFQSTPTNGAVITADYSVDYIPKDSNHVLDIGFSLQFSDGNV